MTKRTIRLNNGEQAALDAVNFCLLRNVHHLHGGC